ncbi:hypothetical protein ACIBAH_31665 [Streptomyces sp. NPDC051445]|uniref:hypothetical protein n=1 Tax=Streptomyces sp. NPDC051445 TaxID=3365653 RepID=UPI00379AB05F
MASVELGDPAALRALAQLRGQRMLEHLSPHGPATWATLALASAGTPDPPAPT